MSEQQLRTPYQIYESIIAHFPAGVDRIDLVRRDQELVLDGWKVHYAIDPHDIGRFCIPINIDEMVKELKPGKVEEISRHQNGRYEAFYNLNRPVLLRRYDDELERSRAWLRRQGNVVNDDEILNRYLAALQLSPQSDPAQTRDVIEDLTERDIGSIIAIVTGILHIGAKRLNEISNRRLSKGRPEGLEEPPKFEGRKEVSDRIKVVLRQYFTAHAGQFEGAQSDLVAPFKEKMIEDRVSTDSQAIDELLWLNLRYNPSKHLVLYFSSSPKSLYLDKQTAALQDILPQIDGEPYPLVRTPDDLFVYMIYKGDSVSEIEKVEAARNSLEKLGKLLRNIAETRDVFKDINEQCLHCNVDVRESPCEYGSQCEGIREYGEAIRTRQYANVNMSLQQRLAESLEKTLSEAHPKSYQQQILDAISRTIDEKGPKPEQRRMNFLMNVSVTKASFVSKAIGPNNSSPNVKVSCYLNSFPTNLEIRTPELRNIFDEVVELFKTRNNDKFEEYVGQYLKFDANIDENAESELMRSFLYLTMGKASEATAISNTFLYEKQSIDPTLETVRREFLYLLCFSLWREKNYQEAIRIADEGCRIYSDDGRFFHSRSVVRLDLMTSKRKRKKRAASISPVSEYQMMLQDTLTALELFTQSGNTLMAAVCYNNAAFYVSDTDFAMIDAAKARGYFERLVELIPETEWNPIYPEFFHTKGCVLYSSFLTSLEKLQLLREAQIAACQALELNPAKKEHKDLVKRINQALEKF
jgi:tetratricopeptide (TPR) repeat protein